MTKLRCRAVLFLSASAALAILAPGPLLPRAAAGTAPRNALPAPIALRARVTELPVGKASRGAARLWSKGDAVVWSVDAERAAALDVSITYASGAPKAGGRFQLAGAGSRAEAEIHPTGGEGKFLTLPIGSIAVPAGRSEIALRLEEAAPGGALVLRSLSLERGFVPLFNGRDLSGWEGSVKGYEAHDGMISCIPHKGGNLYTAREYSDFVFRFEFRLQRGSNNGLGIRTPRGVDAAYHGMEIQILDDGADVYRNIKSWQHHGSIYNVVAAKPGHLRPVGEWNTEEVVADRRHIVVRLNGVTIVDANLDDVKDPATLKKHPGLARTKGYIGFLGHGSRVDLRDIRVRELGE